MAKKKLHDYTLEELKKQAKSQGLLANIFSIIMIISGIMLVVDYIQHGVFRPIYAAVFLLFIAAFFMQGSVRKIKAEIAKRSE
jgi:Flp pilus assembly protein TadB